MKRELPQSWNKIRKELTSFFAVIRFGSQLFANKCHYLSTQREQRPRVWEGREPLSLCQLRGGGVRGVGAK
jgi:hypothetical protein